MRPSGNLVADTICRTAEIGVTITAAADAGTFTIIDAAPVALEGHCPDCTHPGTLRDHTVCCAPGLMETSNSRKDNQFMGAPRKYPEELRERATRMALDAMSDPDRAHGAIARTAEQLGVHKEALRTWVRKTQADGVTASSVDSDRDARLAELERENRELRRANTILKQASAFFAAELDRPQR